ncbi:MAG: 50S ribosomal protein L29 [Candidatus Omnitrophica bacterium]|nr:50S ribosomal protein L29 [Candidatus Omnitrophota bacterium]MBU4487535.1 50S ribosomal protein L29 [Candidatus Omnitrophota bacterium]MCG2705775.1 50S ribosomal protein L29 [Candidatus Omnitrophota bacterium]
MKAKINELRQLDANEMREKVDAMEKELYNLRYQASTSQVEKPHRIKEIRREIAVYKTLIREKELANAKR